MYFGCRITLYIPYLLARNQIDNFKNAWVMRNRNFGHLWMQALYLRKENRCLHGICNSMVIHILPIYQPLMDSSPSFWIVSSVFTDVVNTTSTPIGVEGGGEPWSGRQSLWAVNSENSLIFSSTYHTKQLNPRLNLYISQSCGTYVACSHLILVQGSHLRITQALLNVWQASEQESAKAAQETFSTNICLDC